LQSPQALKAIDAEIDLSKMNFLEAVWRSTVRNSDLPDSGKLNSLETETCGAINFTKDCLSHQLMLFAQVFCQ